MPQALCTAQARMSCSELCCSSLTLAYTYYAFFEWSLVMWDVAFDAGTVFEVGNFQIRVIDTSRPEIEDDKNGCV